MKNNLNNRLKFIQQDAIRLMNFIKDNNLEHEFMKSTDYSTHACSLLENIISASDTGNSESDNWAVKQQPPTNEVYKFPRKCDLTHMGMWEGYCFGDGQDYAINKAGAVVLAMRYGYETLEEAWEDDAYYFSEWQELDEDGWYESDYADGRDAVWVDAE